MANGAVVIGCSGYEDPDISELRYAHHDAARIASTLSGICGIAEDMLLVLSDDATDSSLKPTRTNIVRQVSGWDRLPVIDGILFCFFSGHGFQSDGIQYFLPIDCVRSMIVETAVKFDLLLRMLSVSPARHVVLLLDACRSIVEGGKASSDSILRADVAELCPSGMVSFCSCRPGKASYEADEIRSGIFTAGLCEALSDQGRCRTVYELDKFLTKRIPELAAAHGKPRQDLYSKVEPLGVAQLSVVSPLQQNLWLAATPIGGERRTNSAPAPISRYKAAGAGEPLVAFDFGTSFSAAATVGADGGSVLVPWSGQRILMPSVVHFLPGLDYLVGAAAVEADRYAPQSTIWHVKRSLATGASFEIGGRSISPELAASLILRSLRASVEESLGSRVRRCLVSYPANFSIAQRNALQRSFELADLDIYRMIGEPNAAALTLRGTDPVSFGACLVVDLGGGTFDVAVVEYGYGSDPAQGLVYEIKTVSGSNVVGGLDFDAALAGYIERELREHVHWEGRLDPIVAAQVHREANRAKRELGLHESATILLQDIEVGARGLQDISIHLSREKFREITEPLNAQIRDVLSDILDAWRDCVADDESRIVLLAGQGSKIFTVRAELDRLNLGARYITQFQETAVAYGLGLQAGVLSGTLRDTLLVDLSPVGLGLRGVTWTDVGESGPSPEDDKNRSVAGDDDADNAVELLISSDTTIPTRRSGYFRVAASVDNPVRVMVVEDRRGSIVEIGAVMLPGHEADRIAEFTIDIDAGNTITVQVRDPVLMEYRSFQLNNLNAMPAPYLTGQYDDPRRLLESGYALYPVQPMDTPVAAPGSAVRLDNFIASELAILESLIADAERSGRGDPTTDGVHAMYYAHRAVVHELRDDPAAAALDYLKTFSFGRAGYSSELSRVLAKIEPANKKIATALETGITALDPARCWFYVDDLERLATTLDQRGYPASGASCRKVAATARRLGEGSSR